TPGQIAWSDVARREPPPKRTVDERLSEAENLALREAEIQNLEQQRAAQAEARAKAQADAEDAAAAQVDAAAAQEAAAAQAEAQRIADEEAALGAATWADVDVKDEPLVNVIPPGSSTTNQDIALADVRGRQQQARQSALNLRLNKARNARLKAEEIKRQEVAEQAADRREEAAQRREQEQRTRINDERKAAADARAEERAVAEAERKRKAEDAKEQAEFEKRETNKTVAEAQASASETIAEFETRPLTISEMKTQMRVRGNKMGDADRIGASEAKAEYLDTVRKGINEIDSARVAAATAEKAKAATTPKAAPAATEKKPDTKPTAPVTDEASQAEALEERIAQLKEGIASLPTTEPRAQAKEEGKTAAKENWLEEVATTLSEMIRVLEGGAAEKKPDTTPSQADVTPPVPDAETDRETFETVDGVTMTRDYTFSTEDVGMSKSEFNTFNTEGKGVVPDYYIDIMAEKRLAGDSFNKYEENALTWPGVSEKVAQAEGRRREEAAPTAEAKPEPEKTTKKKAKKKAQPKVDAGDVVEAGVVVEPDRREKKESVKKGETTFKRFSQSRDGKSWTAKIAGASAKITIDEVGEYHTTYDGRSDPLPFASL
ncbi:MAG: hypothetical protein QGI80_02485, partial [archaeon]|nr:hypothetical protein [archaeon]